MFKIIYNFKQILYSFDNSTFIHNIIMPKNVINKKNN